MCECVSPVAAVVGGSACPPSIIQRFHELGTTVLHIWGMTELSPSGTSGSLPHHVAVRSPEVRRPVCFSSPAPRIRGEFYYHSLPMNGSAPRICITPSLTHTFVAGSLWSRNNSRSCASKGACNLAWR